MPIVSHGVMEPAPGKLPSSAETPHTGGLSARAVRFFSNPLVGIVGSLASIVGLILAVVFYVHGLANRDVVYAVYPFIAYLARAERPSDLRVEFRGQPLTSSDVIAVQVSIWNQGRLSVRPENILEPLQLVLTPPTPVLEASVVKLGRAVSSVGVSTDPEKLKLGRVPIHFKILERGDGANIQIIFVGRRDTSIQLVGIIEGQGGPQNFSPAQQSSEADESPFKRYQLSQRNRRFSFLAGVSVWLLYVGFEVVVVRGFLRTPRQRTQHRKARGVMAVIVTAAMLGLTWLLWFTFWEWWSNPIPPFGF